MSQIRNTQGFKGLADMQREIADATIWNTNKKHKRIMWLLWSLLGLGVASLLLGVYAVFA